jgi:hypothetical protein
MTISEKFEYIQNSKEMLAERKYFKNVIDGLLKQHYYYFYPNVILLPISITGEEVFQWLIGNHSEPIYQDINRYGYYSQLVKHGDNIFTLIIVNND